MKFLTNKSNEGNLLNFVDASIIYWNFIIGVSYKLNQKVALEATTVTGMTDVNQSDPSGIRSGV